jgi:hypothetical protein
MVDSKKPPLFLAALLLFGCFDLDEAERWNPDGGDTGTAPEVGDEACSNGEDDDGDALEDCNDPDCESASVCQDGDSDTHPAMIPCDGGLLDPGTSLCWQDPMWDDDADSVPDPLPWVSAGQFCEDLVLGGRDDWRLPTISELRTLIRGCPGTETGGECPVSDECTSFDCDEGLCDGCGYMLGPGHGGCFLGPGLNQCDWNWSSIEDDIGGAWTVYFGRAMIEQHAVEEGVAFRCVRPGSVVKR